VSTKEGEAWARGKGGGVLFLESSANEQAKVDAVFREAVAQILESPALLQGTGPSGSKRGSNVDIGARRAADAPKPPVSEGGGSSCCS
jgi:hypothetical protein